MSLLPTITWLNIPFSPHQDHMRHKQYTFYRLGSQHDGAMIGTREKSLSPTPPPLMSEGMKSAWCITVLYGIVVGLVLALPACTDFKKDFPCRPTGHCV